MKSDQLQAFKEFLGSDHNSMLMLCQEDNFFFFNKFLPATSTKKHFDLPVFLEFKNVRSKYTYTFSKKTKQKSN